MCVEQCLLCCSTRDLDPAHTSHPLHTNSRCPLPQGECCTARGGPQHMQHANPKVQTSQAGLSHGATCVEELHRSTGEVISRAEEESSRTVLVLMKAALGGNADGITPGGGDLGRAHAKGWASSAPGCSPPVSAVASAPRRRHRRIHAARQWSGGASGGMEVLSHTIMTGSATHKSRPQVRSGPMPADLSTNARNGVGAAAMQPRAPPLLGRAHILVNTFYWFSQNSPASSSG